MKKTITITVVTTYFLLMGALGIIAAVPGKVNKASKESVRREIVRNIACPGLFAEKKKPMDVKAEVEVDAKGKLSVTGIYSDNEQLKEYVMSQLENLTVKNESGPEKLLLVIHFKAA